VNGIRHNPLKIMSKRQVAILLIIIGQKISDLINFKIPVAILDSFEHRRLENLLF